MHAPDVSITFTTQPQNQDIFFYDTPFPALYPWQEGLRFFVTDSTVAKLPAVKQFLDEAASFGSAVLVLPAGEEHKTINNVLRIVKTALEAGMNRKSVFTAIGGGVITDMTGFAASMFMRGAAWEAVPTTLLAMVDAAIGGKTGCDFESYKNMAGSFYPAFRLHIFPGYVQTLSSAEYRSGLAEAFKTALLFKPDIFTLFKNERERIMQRDASAVLTIVRECVDAKANVVQEDLTEQGRRALLNLGHTFAHALETCAGLGKVSHGDAVAWGISRALTVSENLGLCSASYRDDVCAALQAYGWETSPRHSALRVQSADLLHAMKKDKKNTGAKIRLVLPRGIAGTVVTEVSDQDILRALEHNSTRV